jgi:hypothetical protein
MAVTGMAGQYHNTICAFLECLKYQGRFDAPGAHDPDDGKLDRHRKLVGTGLVRPGVGTPVTQEGNHLERAGSSLSVRTFFTRFNR